MPVGGRYLAKEPRTPSPECVRRSGWCARLRWNKGFRGRPGPLRPSGAGPSIGRRTGRRRCRWSTSERSSSSRWPSSSKPRCLVRQRKVTVWELARHPGRKAKALVVLRRVVIDRNGGLAARLPHRERVARQDLVGERAAVEVEFGLDPPGPGRLPAADLQAVVGSGRGTQLGSPSSFQSQALVDSTPRGSNARTSRLQVVGAVFFLGVNRVLELVVVTGVVDDAGDACDAAGRRYGRRRREHDADQRQGRRQ